MMTDEEYDDYLFSNHIQLKRSRPIFGDVHWIPTEREIMHGGYIAEYGDDLWDAVDEAEL